MAIQDSDPERRNLLITSVAFIVYFYAGGKFPENEVRLQVINAIFSNPEVLGVIAWILLLWFFYRYWQKHSTSFSEGFQRELDGYYKKQYFSKYVSEKIGHPVVQDEDEGYHVERVNWESGKFGLEYCYATNIARDEKTGKIQSWSKRVDEGAGVIHLDDFKGFYLRLLAYSECCFRHPSFSSYIVPYILFALAVLGPVYAYLF